MGPLYIKGVRLGEGRPKTIVSLMGRDQDELLAGARRAVSAGAEILEWRADFFAQVGEGAAVASTAQALAAALPRTPLVFTFRSRGQGGVAELPVRAYAELVREVLATGAADIVDVEKGVEDALARELVAQAREAGAATIVSHHDFNETPQTEWMVDALLSMAELGADVPKLAVMAHSPADCLRLMEATALACEQLDTPVIAMAMGADGVLSRLAGETFGSAATFCALEAASAPGQVELAQATRLLDELHATMKHLTRESVS